jgi:hypothetical protein
LADSLAILRQVSDASLTALLDGIVNGTKLGSDPAHDSERQKRPLNLGH